MQMKSTGRRQTGIAADARGGKHKLPLPLLGRVRVFPVERLGQWGDSAAARDVALVDAPDLRQVLDEAGPDEFRQDADAVLLAFGAACARESRRGVVGCSLSGIVKSSFLPCLFRSVSALPSPLT